MISAKQIHEVTSMSRPLDVTESSVGQRDKGMFSADQRDAVMSSVGHWEGDRCF